MADETRTTATVPAMQAVRPAEKPTIPVDPPPAWAIDMFGRVFEKVEAGLSSVRAEVNDLKASNSRENALTLNTVGAMRGELAAFGVRLGAVESTVYGGGDGGSGVASLARKTSDHNLQQDAVIGLVKADVSEVKAELAATKALIVTNNADTSAIRKALDAFVEKNPKAISSLLWAAVGVVLAALGAAAAWFKGRGQ